MPEDLRSNVILQWVIVLLGALLVAVGAIPAQAQLSPLWTGIGTGLIAAGGVTVLQLALVGDPFNAMFNQLQHATSQLDDRIVKVSDLLRDGSATGVMRVWSTRTAAEREWDEHWVPAIRSARRIDVAAYAAEFLLQDEQSLLAEALTSGASLRLLLGDPAGTSLRARDDEAPDRSGLAARSMASLAAAEKLVAGLGPDARHRVEVAVFDAPLYCSIYRADDQMFVTLSQFGSSGASAPTLLLREGTKSGNLFASYAAHFEALWRSAAVHPRDASN